MTTTLTPTRRPNLTKLGPNAQAVLAFLWRKPAMCASAAEVAEAGIQPQTLRALERRGLIAHDQHGTAYLSTHARVQAAAWTFAQEQVIRLAKKERAS